MSELGLDAIAQEIRDGMTDLERAVSERDSMYAELLRERGARINAETALQRAEAEREACRDAAELGALTFQWVIAASQVCVSWNASVIAMDRARLAILERQHDEAVEIARHAEAERDAARKLAVTDLFKSWLGL